MHLKLWHVPSELLHLLHMFSRHLLLRVCELQ